MRLRWQPIAVPTAMTPNPAVVTAEPPEIAVL